jgi:threonyl-tRNA synthetase
MRHSLAHITATAVMRLWPEAKLGVGPVVENGFYYDIDLGETKISEEDFIRIEKEMKKVIGQNQPFERSEKTIDEALAWAKETKQQYKEELLHDLKRSGTTIAKDLDTEELGTVTDGTSAVETVSFYQNGDFIDLCRGPHVESTGKVGAFKLTRVAGAYWRGKESNPQMQRLYGLAFATKEALTEHLKHLELAKQNDHKKLGREMELFFFEQTSPGMAYWMPKGLTMKNLLIQYWRQYHRERGYQEVSSPLLNKQALFETSGHWSHYKKDMFLSEREDGEWWALKPMNCPNAMKFWQIKQRSYKDLPLRFSDTDVLHRDEVTGALNGLLRARTFTQDDSHNFVTEDQIKEEATRIIQIVRDFYGVFGIDDNVKLYLSTRPEDGYMGDIETWNRAETELTEVLAASGFEFGVKEGDGAFYGPKIDIHLNDALGREWQCGTIQLDFQLPKKFELTYANREGEDKAPVVIHRVIYGSLERFIGVITEHFGGWFPFWFAPEQVRILTINDSVGEYVGEISRVLSQIVLEKPVKYNELRFSTDDRNESLGKKIREATGAKIPVQLIVGPKDQESKEVSVRTRKGEEKVKLSDLEAYLQQTR